MFSSHWLRWFILLLHQHSYVIKNHLKAHKDRHWAEKTEYEHSYHCGLSDVLGGDWPGQNIGHSGEFYLIWGYGLWLTCRREWQWAGWWGWKWRWRSAGEIIIMGYVSAPCSYWSTSMPWRTSTQKRSIIGQLYYLRHCCRGEGCGGKRRRRRKSWIPGVVGWT